MEIPFPLLNSPPFKGRSRSFQSASHSTRAPLDGKPSLDQKEPVLRLGNGDGFHWEWASKWSKSVKKCDIYLYCTFIFHFKMSNCHIKHSLKTHNQKQTKNNRDKNPLKIPPSRKSKNRETIHVSIIPLGQALDFIHVVLHLDNATCNAPNATSSSDLPKAYGSWVAHVLARS